MNTPWIPVSDRLPPSEGRYLVCCRDDNPKNPFVAVTWYGPPAGWDISDYWKGAITHWMPLPETPVYDDKPVWPPVLSGR